MLKNGKKWVNFKLLYFVFLKSSQDSVRFGKMFSRPQICEIAKNQEMHHNEPCFFQRDQATLQNLKLLKIIHNQIIRLEHGVLRDSRKEETLPVIQDGCPAGNCNHIVNEPF